MELNWKTWDSQGLPANGKALGSLRTTVPRRPLQPQGGDWTFLLPAAVLAAVLGLPGVLATVLSLLFTTRLVQLTQHINRQISSVQ